MRLVLDTNVVVSGVLWHGTPRELLDAARAGRATLFATPALLEELQERPASPQVGEAAGDHRRHA